MSFFEVEVDDHQNTSLRNTAGYNIIRELLSRASGSVKYIVRTNANSRRQSLEEHERFSLTLNYIIISSLLHD